MQVRVDGAGRMVIPARLRRMLGLGGGGGVVDIEDTPDGLWLQSLDAAVPTRRRDDHGLLVLDLGRDVTNDETRAAIDEDRGRRG